MNATDPTLVVAKYWEDVLHTLMEAHGVEPDAAFRATTAYRNRLAEVGALDAVYHWEATETAAAVAGGGYETHPPLPGPTGH